MADTTVEPFGVYVHWPFCAAKCPYCDFNSHVRREPVDQDEFAVAYESEIAHFAALAPGRHVSSIFFGGGTPSLMEPSTVERILAAIAKAWSIDAACEISLEANPSSVEARRFRGYRDAGVNRLSLGVQSFDDAQLRFLGRLHDAATALGAIALARDIFPRMSFDLIYARPNQTLDAWEAELGQALAFGVDHLSLYQLTIEKGTPFFDLFARGRLRPPEMEHAAQLYELTRNMTGAAGLPAYEVSNHARPGGECGHNLVYWRYFDYAGIGPGAHGRLTLDGIKRASETLRGPHAWHAAAMREGHGLTRFEALSSHQAAEEMLLMGLRLGEGLDLVRLARFTGLALASADIAFYRDHGLLEPDGGDRLCVSKVGFLVLDRLVRELAAGLAPLSAPIHDAEREKPVGAGSST